MALVYRFVCMWENKRRDKIGAEGFDHAYEDDLTDMKVSAISFFASKVADTIRRILNLDTSFKKWVCSRRA